mmetsp:Transcript_22718/g.21942  ORF Transcript_22718/g.21942 Transcript_22718/m.21942 type:complete len:147 (+) Transcript_22718:106-546(+)
MAAIYNNRTWNGKEEWRFRTKIKVIKGSSPFRYTPYLWSSKKDATDDEPLFRFLKDKSRISPIYKPKIPNAPHNNEWFVTITPNNDWQSIRDYLQSQKGIVTPPATNKKRYLSTKNNVDETYKNKKRNNKLKQRLKTITCAQGSGL